MKKTMKTMVATALSALTTVGATTLTYAAGDYAVLRGSEIRLGDDSGATQKGRFTFTLPANYNSTQTVILQMRVRGATAANVHEIYINPPSNSALSLSGNGGCLDNGSEPAGDQATSIGFVDFHETVSGLNEAFFQHMTLSGSLFRAGQQNMIVICPRSAAGKVDLPGVSGDDAIDVDDIFLSGIVLQFKTN